MRRSVIILTIFILAVIAEHAVLRSREIIFQKSSVDTKSAPSFHLDDSHLNRVSRHASSQTHQYLLHVGHPLTSSEHQAIEDFIGVKLGQYLPHNTYLLVATDEVARLATDAPNVLWIGALAPEHKIAAGIKYNHDRYDVMVAPDAAVISSIDVIASQWEQLLLDARVHAKCQAFSDRIRVTFTRKSSALISRALMLIADQPESHYIEASYSYSSMNQFASATIQTNGEVYSGQVGATPYSVLFNGSDQMIGLADTGIRKDSCFFTNANIVYNSTYGDTTDATGHGTQVAGTLVGSNGVGASANGILPKATLYFNDIQKGTGDLTPPTPVTTMFAAPSAAGVRIYAMPFGSNADYYNADSAAIDTYVAGNPNFLVVVPSGNANEPTNNRSLTNFAYSKNALVVGASQSIFSGVLQAATDALVIQNLYEHLALYGSQVLASFSSRGPTPDGRIKPDIVAPGMYLNTSSSTDTCGTTLVHGTSYATGVAAASAGIVRSFLNQGYDLSGTPSNFGNNQDPTAALVKAALINGAQSLITTDATGNGTWINVPQPSGLQGFGRIELGANLYVQSINNIVNDRIYLVDSGASSALSTGGNFIKCINATNTGRITATLVWTDLPGSPTAGLQLINDLDLVIIDQKGSEYRTTTGDGEFDSVNNVEHTFVDAQMKSLFAVYVHGRNVPGNNAKAPFALVISGPFALINCPVFEGQTGSFTCPNGCSGHGTCSATGCACATGYSGVDCSLTPCPTNSASLMCSGNGVCDFVTGECSCGLDFSTPDCSAVIPPPPPVTAQNNTIYVSSPSTNSSGISTGLLVGLVIAAFIIGGIIFMIVGLCLAVRYLEYKRDKAMAARAAADEEMN